VREWVPFKRWPDS